MVPSDPILLLILSVRTKALVVPSNPVVLEIKRRVNTRNVNTQISILLLCFLYLFVELMIMMNE